MADLGKGWRVESPDLARKPGTPWRFGSSGYLEIALNQGQTADKLRMKPGDPLVIRLRK
jgi:S-adenosylmethionine hydrolase